MRLHPVRAGRRWALGLLAVAATTVAAACGSDDTATAPSISPTLLSAPPAGLVSSTTSTAVTEAATSAPATTVIGEVPSTTSVPASTSSGPEATVTTAVQPVPTTPQTVATGVPGGSSDTALCRDYATVVGSQSVLTIAGAFGDLDTAALARLELIAAPSMVSAAEALDADWPAELAGEQALVERSVITPIADRAAVARFAVDAAAIDDAVLVTAWQAALAAYDPGNPAVTVTGLTPAVEAALATAASTYAATSVRYDMDPSVLRTAPTPDTTAYLFQHCPELSYLIAGDAD